MSFLDHIEVLRWHLVRSTIVILVFAIAAFIFKEFIFDDVILAQKNADFWTYRLFCDISHLLGRGDALCMDDIKFSIINITMSGQFSTHIVTSLVAGLILAFPYILFEVWRFISPALEKKEKKYARYLVFSGSLLFTMGILFGYYFVSPLSVQFLGNYQISESVTNQIDLKSFISTVTTVTLVCGLVFELPLLVYFLSKIGIMTPEFMRKYRKHAVVITLVVSAILTPPDVSSQVLLSIPLLILYEFSIYISKIVNKKAAH
ncbi:MAG: twin-arginine translocase subunit TatC [Flavobacteriales bacterium]|nr:twin-arginine translocase subunit TatC [Flavobacteriales bacterium]